MTSLSSDVTTLLGSRICHDLISPLGAIANGVELLELSGDSTGPELALISESVENATQRIRFFRVAFGAATEAQSLAEPEIRAMLPVIGAGRGLTVDWQITGTLPRTEVKLAFLLLQCIEAAMPWGGVLTITRRDERWDIAGQSDRLKTDLSLWEALSNPDAAGTINASEVEFLLAPAWAAATGRSIIVQIAEPELRLRF